MGSAGFRERLAFIVGTVFEGSLLGVAWLAGWLLDEPPLGRFAWTLRDAGLGVAATVPMILAFVMLLRGRAAAVVEIRRFLDELLLPMLAPCTVAELALLAL